MELLFDFGIGEVLDLLLDLLLIRIVHVVNSFFLSAWNDDGILLRDDFPQVDVGEEVLEVLLEVVLVLAGQLVVRL